MDAFRLTAQQVAVLRTLHRTLRDKRLADRVKAIVLIGIGWSVADVAQALLVDKKTVYLWLDKYLHSGQEELIILCYQGKACSQTEQQQELANHLDDTTYLTSHAIRDYINTKYGIEYSPSGIKDLLHRRGFAYKKPKHVPDKLDPAKQESFVEEYESLRKNKGRNDPIYFADACHPQHNSIPAYGWIRRGTEKMLKSNGGRKRVNIHGAVNIGTLDTVVDFTKTVNKESSLRLFQEIIKKHPKAKVIPIILDNATYYTSRWLKAQ